MEQTITINVQEGAENAFIFIIQTAEATSEQIASAKTTAQQVFELLGATVQDVSDTISVSLDGEEDGVFTLTAETTDAAE